MKSVSLIGNNIDIVENIIYTGCFSLENQNINVGLVQEEDLELSSEEFLEDYVLIEKKGFSCNYRDKSLVLGNDKQIKEFGKIGEPTFSYIGSEFVGVVVQIGKEVRHLKIGDRVILNVSYPSYDKHYEAGLPSNHCSKRYEVLKSNKLFKIPDNLEDDLAAGFSIAAFTSYSMIRKVVKEGAKILVTSAKSNTSLATIAALQNFSVEVYAMSSSDSHIEELLKMGVKEVFVIDHNKSSYFENDKLLSFVRNNGFFNAVIDPMFDVHLPKIFEVMAFDSKYITCGFQNQMYYGGISKILEKGNQLKEMMKILMEKNISIIGNCIGLKEDFDLAMQHFERGTFRPPIEKVFTQGSEADFFDKTFSCKNRFGKVIYLY